MFAIELTKYFVKKIKGAGRKVYEKFCNILRSDVSGYGATGAF